MTRASFAAWTTTGEGRAAIDEAAGRIRFSFLGRRRSAARRLWRQLADMSRNGSCAAAIAVEVQTYLRRLGAIAFAEGLPRTGVDLRRLIVVPIVLLNGAACSAIANRLKQHPAWASLEGGDPLRDFFITTLIHEMETAVAAAHPSPANPLTADPEWVTVGLNRTFVWRVPVFHTPPWDGHHYVLELTREPITRAVRKGVAARIAVFEASLRALSRAERADILHRARL